MKIIMIAFIGIFLISPRYVCQDSGKLEKQLRTSQRLYFEDKYDVSLSDSGASMFDIVRRCLIQNSNVQKLLRTDTTFLLMQCDVVEAKVWGAVFTANKNYNFILGGVNNATDGIKISEGPCMFQDSIISYIRRGRFNHIAKYFSWLSSEVSEIIIQIIVNNDERYFVITKSMADYPGFMKSEVFGSVTN